MKRTLKRLVGAGLLAAVVYALWRAWHARVPERSGEVEWSSAPFPFPPVPRPASESASESESQPPWTEPDDAGTCPASHPIKGKLSSGIYHAPGGANYDRTHADRCYLDEDAALRDGLRRSKV